ncbi:MAG TPA: efflux RND transporter periplasmic adaptor subunit [Longimicrobiales bacterium]|nr:efflux RND transporter periplasmic adaptor subunit [Longimicrobiales bacterium]
MRTLPLPLGLVLLPLALAACGREVRADADAPTEGAPRLAADAGASGRDGAGVAGTDGADTRPVAPGPAGVASSSSVLYSERDAEVTSRIRGVVTAVLVELGDTVRAGQLLGRLDAAEQAAALADADAAYRFASAEHQRVLPLRDAELIEAAALDRAVYALRSAEARRDHARALLDHTFIRAPFDGVVSRRFVRLAQTIEPAQPLFRVTAMSPLRLRLMVPERDAAAVAVGAEAALHGATGTAAARVIRIAPAVDPAGGTVEVLLEVPRPGALRPGSAVRVEWRRP